MPPPGRRTNLDGQRPGHHKQTGDQQRDRPAKVNENLVKMHGFPFSGQAHRDR